MSERHIIHLDMDAFYASVEQRDNPALRGKPVIVGGHPTRGVVLAASYEVRPFGVRSAMPMSRAVKAAPHAVVVPPRFEAYVDASEAVFRIFERYTPLVEALSLDEAFLDVTASETLFGSPAEMARRLRKEIRAEVGLPASAGIAEIKFVAKIASDLAKPDGQLEVPAGTSKAFLAPLPVSRLWGVGPKTDEVLQRAGLRTIGDVAAKDVAWLVEHLGSGGQHLWELSQAIDSRHVVPDHDAKSVGAQDTFGEDVKGEEALKPQIHGQALRVARRLRRSKVRARVVQLTVKYSDFTLVTRRRTLDEPTDDGQVLYKEAVALLSRVDLNRKMRLTGVSGQELVSLEQGGPQLALFEQAATSPPPRSARLNQALDKIASKFGSGAVLPADLAREGSPLPRDGFYREAQRESVVRADEERQRGGPQVEPEE